MKFHDIIPKGTEDKYLTKRRSEGQLNPPLQNNSQSGGSGPMVVKAIMCPRDYCSNLWITESLVVSS